MIQDTEINVTIDGTKFSGWQEPRVNRVMGSLCGDFAFSLVDFPVDSTKDVLPGSSVTIEMDGKPFSHKLISGYIDTVTRSKAGEETKLSFTGRDKTADLIDCSAIYENSTWKKKKVSEICKDICKPFDIKVVLDTTDQQVDNFALQSGETAFAAIERLTSAFGILPITDELGRLKLSKVGVVEAGVKLEVGKNIKSINIEEDFSNRFSTYKAKGQGKGSGDEWKNDIVSLVGNAYDDVDVKRYRPLVFCVEKKMNQSEIQKRVNWEAQVRAGRAVRCTVDVVGWLKDPESAFSAPWAVNELVNLKDEKWGINSKLVISSVTFALSETTGRITTLELSPPEIFSSEPGARIQLAKRSYVRPNP